MKIGKSTRFKRFTAKQKKFLAAKGIRPNAYWLQTETNETIVLVSKRTGKARTIMKEEV